VASHRQLGPALTGHTDWVSSVAFSPDIADHLVISVHTVQSHLRNIFTKTGVRARRDLVTKIFFAHYEPRLRDNEQRTATNLPLRGGPAAATRPHARPGQVQAEPAAT
jgi:Bacterial regulatory proteins, luxR family